MANVRGNVILENVRIMFRNFAGKGTEYNPEGRRNFCIALNPEDAENLRAIGWNVKTLPPRDEYEQPQDYIQVMVSYKFEDRAPHVVRISGRNRTAMTESNISNLDWEEIENVDLEFVPYNWDKAGRSGTTAYLKSMYVTVKEDRLAAKYAVDDYAGPDEVPFD